MSLGLPGRATQVSSTSRHERLPLSTRRACKQGRTGAPSLPCRICLLCSARGQADCSSRPRASRSSSRGRGVGPVFRLFAPSFSSLFFRFSVLVSQVLSWSRRCAVATSAIRGVSRDGCAASPCSGKVPPDSRGQWYQEHRAPTQEPRIFQVSPSVFGTQLGIAVLIYLWGVLGLRFLTLPAVTSASEVLTQAFVKFEVESYMCAYRIVLLNRTWSFLFPESGVIWR